jgi:hypothetical protein
MFLSSNSAARADVCVKSSLRSISLSGCPDLTTVMTVYQYGHGTPPAYWEKRCQQPTPYMPSEEARPVTMKEIDAAAIDKRAKLSYTEQRSRG